MIFMHKILPATKEQWGICTECAKKSPVDMLCSACLERRSAYFHKQIAERDASWEYRFRSWVVKLFDPTKSKRY